MCKRATRERKNWNECERYYFDQIFQRQLWWNVCSCGEMCKDQKGLKFHQAKTKCEMSENKILPSTRKCFVSLKDVENKIGLLESQDVFIKTKKFDLII